MTHFTAYLKLLRIDNWIKNLFIFVGVLYSKMWYSALLWQKLFLIFIAFCLAASAIYVLNDIHDRDSDSHHPRKQHRPIANGTINIRHGYYLVSGLLICSFLLAYAVSSAAIIILSCYYLLNILYTFMFKDIPILDSCGIAGGFALRVLAGTTGVGIKPSFWLITCTLFLTLFLGFSKRHAELNIVGDKKILTRPVLRYYAQRYLSILLISCASLALFSYSIYCLYNQTLMITLPLVLAGLLRYLYLLQHNYEFDDPIMLVITDIYSIATLILWVGLTIYLLR